ncbi:MAG: type II secretion system F family protein [Defluviitaleaceae bacterium]|nr:type II secretion system F family protein [Defluviitaleaceae bacterium]
MPIAPYPSKSKGNSDPKPISIWHRDISSLFRLKYAPQAPIKEISVFCRKLSFLLGAGIPIKSALSIVSEQLPGRGLRRLMPKLNARVQQGQSFSDAIAALGAFPSFFCGFVSIGEATAKLPQVMEQLADFYDEQAKIKDGLTAALVYPIAVAFMMLGVIILAITFVLPGYSRIFAASGAPLPALTRGLMSMSEFLIHNATLVIIFTIVTFIMAIIFATSKPGRGIIAQLALQFPITRQGINYKLTQGLHLLLSAGLPISQALPLTEDVMGNIQVKKDIANISAVLKTGKPFWVALSEVKYMDPLLVGLARVGEETGHMSQTIDKCQSYYANSYKQAIKRLNKLVEPVITLVLGIGLGIIMLAVILPTFELATIL